ncbi:MAG: hypothetical protein GQ577_03985, partial [Woeseiaceae bacterium]|nr:hypothetical protein [Woeseiaceae bacterium]
APLPIIEMLAGDRVQHSDLSDTPFLSRVREHQNAIWMYRRLVENASLEALSITGRYMQADMMYLTNLLRDEIQSCVFGQDAPRFRFSLNDVMSRTLPFLDAEQGVALVDAFSTAGCAAQQEQNSLLWFDLYRAVAQRDGREMADASRRLLSDDAATPRRFHDYLVTAAALGDIAAGRPERAREVWEKFADSVFAGRVLPGHIQLIGSIAMGSEVQ